MFGQNPQRTQEFESVISRKVDILTVFPAREGGWNSILDPWWLGTAPANFKGTLDVAVPLFPNDGDLATAAAGGYGAQWEQLGKLIATRYPDAYVRPGWEMNIDNWPWKATSDNAEQWKMAYRHAAIALKRGGPDLRVQWVVNSGEGNSLEDAKQVYPGDDVVDVVGVNAYDWSNEDSIDEVGGVKDWLEFSQQHGKMFSLPEWGVHRGDEGDGDDPQFVTRMVDTLKKNANTVAFASYFDEPESHIANSVARGQAPRAAAALRAGFASAAGSDASASDSSQASPANSEGRQRLGGGPPEDQLYGQAL